MTGSANGALLGEEEQVVLAHVGLERARSCQSSGNSSARPRGSITAPESRGCRSPCPSPAPRSRPRAWLAGPPRCAARSAAARWNAPARPAGPAPTNRTSMSRVSRCGSLIASSCGDVGWARLPRRGNATTAGPRERRSRGRRLRSRYPLDSDESRPRPRLRPRPRAAAARPAGGAARLRHGELRAGSGGGGPRLLPAQRPAPGDRLLRRRRGGAGDGATTAAASARPRCHDPDVARRRRPRAASRHQPRGRASLAAAPRPARRELHPQDLRSFRLCGERCHGGRAPSSPAQEGLNAPSYLIGWSLRPRSRGCAARARLRRQPAARGAHCLRGDGGHGCSCPCSWPAAFGARPGGDCGGPAGGARARRPWRPPRDNQRGRAGPGGPVRRSRHHLTPGPLDAPAATAVAEADRAAALAIATPIAGGHHDHAGHGGGYRHVDAGRAAALYVCPMHPAVTGDRPGSCPLCGMALERKVE